MIVYICGHEVIIDEEDIEMIKSKKWHHKHYSGGIYFSSYDKRINGINKHHRLHRIIIGIGYGEKIIVDHINGNTLDCRKENLRTCTIQQNLMNSKISKTNKTGYKGVSVFGEKFRSTISVNRKQVHLGLFNCPTTAWLAYVRAAIELHGEFARFS